MNNFTKGKILVPWDFSEMSKEALAEAFKIAESPEQVFVTHVTSYPSAADPSVIWGSYTEDDIRNNIRESFRKEVPESQVSSQHFSTSFGDPGSQIATLAKELNVGLIVISSHGRTGLSRVFVGSVAERVVRLAPCPVLVLRK